jgi:glutathione peroxidase-family protein
VGYYEAFAEWCAKMPALQVIAIPSNQFGAQEPGTPEEIKAYVYGEVERGRGGKLDGSLKSLPNFTLLAKSTINGNGTHPIFKLAKDKVPGETNCECAQPPYPASIE